MKKKYISPYMSVYKMKSANHLMQTSRRFYGDKAAPQDMDIMDDYWITDGDEIG